jgi:mono/diheme cytochrome c family protein
MRVTVGSFLFVLLAAPSLAADKPPAAPPAGKELFYSRCGPCHLQGGMGTSLLSRRVGADKALIEQRNDVAADYVKTVVRNGLLNMPRLSRAEVSDAELAAIAEYLSRPKAR